MAQVLIYNIRDTEKLRRLRTVLLRRGVSLRAVEYAEYGHPLGRLCGREGFEGAEPYTGPDFRDEMLVMEGFSSRQMSAFLDELRSERIAVALKAVVTDTNALWSSAALHAAILEEHLAMTAFRAKTMQKQNKP